MSLGFSLNPEINPLTALASPSPTPAQIMAQEVDDIAALRNEVLQQFAPNGKLAWNKPVLDSLPPVDQRDTMTGPHMSPELPFVSPTYSNPERTPLTATELAGRNLTQGVPELLEEWTKDSIREKKFKEFDSGGNPWIKEI